MYGDSEPSGAFIWENAPSPQISTTCFMQITPSSLCFALSLWGLCGNILMFANDRARIQTNTYTRQIRGCKLCVMNSSHPHETG